GEKGGDHQCHLFRRLQRRRRRPEHGREHSREAERSRSCFRKEGHGEEKWEEEG
ncbi:hypothetical protein U1Q18_022666, partial [Sarracenia purpurea var. burkii]